jgi:hypothetical protein
LYNMGFALRHVLVMADRVHSDRHKRTRQWIGNYYCTRLSLRGNMKLGLF